MVTKLESTGTNTTTTQSIENQPVKTGSPTNPAHASSITIQSKEPFIPVNQDFTSFLKHVKEEGHTWKDKLLNLIVNYHEATGFFGKARHYLGFRVATLFVGTVAKESPEYQTLKKQSDFFRQMPALVAQYNENPQESHLDQLQTLTLHANFPDLNTIEEILQKELGQNNNALSSDMKELKLNRLNALLVGNEPLTTAALPATLSLEEATQLRTVIETAKSDIQTANAFYEAELARIDQIPESKASEMKQELGRLVGLEPGQIGGSKEQLKAQADSKFAQSVENARLQLETADITITSEGDLSFIKFI